MLLAATGLALLGQTVPEVTSTAKDRTGLGITIYRNNLAMIRETRNLQLPCGPVQVAFTDVAASIKPKSAWMEFPNTNSAPFVLERNFEFNLLTPASAVDHSLGLPAAYRNPVDGNLHWGTLASIPLRKKIWAPNRTPLQRISRTGPVLRQADPDVLISTAEGYQDIPGDQVFFHTIPAQLRSSPTLLASLESTQPGNCPIEMAYTAGGFTWEATYVMRLSPSGKAMDLDGFATLTNNSGTDFPEATLQLVAGDPNQVYEPLPRDAEEPLVDQTTVCCVASAAAPRFKEESLSDYLLLTLDRPTHLRNGQTKQIKLFTAENVPIERTFLFEWRPELRWFEASPTRAAEPGRWIEGSEWLEAWAIRVQGLDSTTLQSGPWPESLRNLKYPDEIPGMPPQFEAPKLLLGFKNETASNLGRPLPQGTVWLRVAGAAGEDIPVGDMSMEATPVGDHALMPGPDSWLAAGIQGRLLWRPSKWRKDWMELEVESQLINHRTETVSAMVRVELPESTEIRSATAPLSKFQAGLFDFRLTLPSGGQATLRFLARIPRNALPFSY